MPGEKPLFQDSFLAAADLSEKRYYAVKLDSAGKIVLAGAGEGSIGILQRGEGVGKVCPVMMLGISYAILGAAVATPGTNLTPDAAGKLVAAGGSDVVIAYNMIAGNTGDIIPVCLVTRTSSGITGLSKSYMTYSFPVELKNLDNGNVVTDFTPGFAGKIKKIDFVTHTPATTASKTATLTAKIETTAVTGGQVDLTTVACNTMGKVTAGSAVTAANAFTASQKISIAAADTATPFIEGTGTVIVTVEI